MPPRFQRARKPEEKEVRRQAILKASRRLMDQVGAVDFSLSDLARASRVSKPNIYRYFESREEVLLQLWVEEVRELTDRLERSFGKVAAGDIAATSRAVVAGFAARRQLCELTSIISPVVERNLSADAILTAKMTLVGLTSRIAQLLHERLPSISIADCAWAASAIAIYVAGIWPAVNPAPAVAEVLARPELAGMQPDFERDFTRFVEVLFAGLAARESSARGETPRPPRG